ncbi:hypothetical protein Q7F17_14800 [Escherichia coli]|uniref:hypothetical protein n=1 Tax=Enterobacteriaceae TaxID=543 RepID=UPI0016609861|nr:MULTISPECIES: hypothetical protein [Enterobacteriaceae]MBD0791081.1 hypothetical protein [Klebsiella sp. K5]MDO8867127.1 hypothetical protein [Escherichia coli]HBQ4498613.1 hypothetical protein [Escherichia coli]HEH7183697.1 hypothetical protein [Escherichia coli]
MISRKELFAEISNEAVTEDGEVVGYFVKNSRMNLLEQMLCDTVTVKLPNQTQFDDPLSAYEAIEKCKEALTAAGIKVEGE